MTPAELAVASLATYRLTRLAVSDEITRPLRERYVEPLLEQTQPIPIYADDELIGHGRWGRRARIEGRAAYLASCPWCLSVWIAAALVLPRGGRLREALAVAGAAGLLLDRDRS